MARWNAGLAVLMIPSRTRTTPGHFALNPALRRYRAPGTMKRGYPMKVSLNGFGAVPVKP